MNELMQLLRSGQLGSAPRTFQDTLQAIAGVADIRESRIPALSGSTGQVPDLPGFRRKILVDPSAIDARSILAHEAGHVLDFSSPEGQAIREAFGLDREEFAEEFEGALLDPVVRNVQVSPVRAALRELIQMRLASDAERRQRARTASQDATRVGLLASD